MKKLFYGDNLQILREQIGDESVDLIYLDPPFNSKRDYNLLFKTPKGYESDAQITAFEDTWHWGEQAQDEFREIEQGKNTQVAEMMRALRNYLGENDMMAYLTMMANRLLEMHRVLKPTGSLYLHCDPTASHYLKIVLDGVFGKENYRNEIIWKRSYAHSDGAQGSKHFGRITDTIFFYTKSDEAQWNVLYGAYDESYVERDYRRLDEDGRRYRLDNIQGPGGAQKGNPSYEVMGVTRYWRYSKEKMDQLIKAGRIIQTSPGTVPQYKRYLDEMPGVPVQNLWDDLPVINNRAKEYLGYPTQKPLALLKRIIEASSNENDVVLDPFCGCGTALDAAQELKRNWIGIDITHLAISLIEKRLLNRYPELKSGRLKTVRPELVEGSRDATSASTGSARTDARNATSASTGSARTDVRDATSASTGSARTDLFEVIGVPQDFAGARDLAERDKHQFQLWACALVNVQPYRGGKKGADQGIDGMGFIEVAKSKTEKVLVSVKGGEHVGASMIRDLKGTVEREKAAIGLFVTLTPPTKPMTTEAASAGHYESPHHGAFPRIQILTIQGLLDGTERPHWPDLSFGEQNFKKAKAAGKNAKQKGLFEE